MQYDIYIYVVRLLKVNKNIAMSAHIGDHLQSYFKLSRVLWLEIRFCGSVTVEYSNCGNCFFVVFQAVGGVEQLSRPLLN